LDFYYYQTVAGCWCEPPFTGRVCGLQLLPGFSNADFLWFESLRTHDHYLKFETPPTWRARSSHTLRHRVAQLYPRYLISPIHSTQPLRLYVLDRQVKSKSKLYEYYDRQSAGQSILVSGTHLGPATNFSPIFFNYI
jgi:hypothetical protein